MKYKYYYLQIDGNCFGSKWVYVYEDIKIVRKNLKDFCKSMGRLVVPHIIFKNDKYTIQYGEFYFSIERSKDKKILENNMKSLINSSNI
jgi:hypothetical protein